MSAAGRAEAARLRSIHSLDASTKCAIPGCTRHMPLPATRCSDHGGPNGPWWDTEADGTTSYWWPATLDHENDPAEDEGG